MIRLLTTLFLASLLLLPAGGCGSGSGGAVDGIATSADGTPIHFTARGSGSPTLVFVHGWSCDSTYWREQMERFAPTHRVVAIDLAGHGESSAVRERYTMDAFGQDVAAVLNELEIDDAILIGHSMGGAVVVEAALAAPDRVRGLVGVDNFQQLTMGLEDHHIAGFVEALTTNFQGTVKPWVMTMFPADADSTLRETIAADMAAGAPAVGISAMGHLLTWYNAKTETQLKQLTVPLMCISSDFRPTDEEALRSAVPAFQVRYMKGKGHFLMREDPEQFDKLLKETIAAME